MKIVRMAILAIFAVVALLAVSVVIDIVFTDCPPWPGSACHTAQTDLVLRLLGG